MRRCLAAIPLSLSLSFVVPALAAAQAAPTPAPSLALPADHVLVTVILRHDQSLSLDEINKKVDASGFWREFPPEGIEVVSWYVAMGIGHVVTLKLPPARLRELNLAVERTAWGAYRSEFYPTYDYKELASRRRVAAKEAAKK
jgi:hypothetical protein